MADTGYNTQKPLVPKAARRVQGELAGLAGGGGRDNFHQQPEDRRGTGNSAHGMEGMSMLQTVIGTAAIVGVGSLALNAVLPSAQDRFAALDQLTYENGQFTQSFITSPEGVQMRWAAGISQGGQIICPSGSGVGTYVTREAVMGIDIWVGLPGCEDRLKDGEAYTALAWWEYEAEKGNIVTISGEVSFVYQKE